jgi:hypothetical protein
MGREFPVQNRDSDLRHTRPPLSVRRSLGGSLIAGYFQGRLWEFGMSMLPFLAPSVGGAAMTYGSLRIKKIVTDAQSERVEKITKGFMEDCKHGPV